MKNRTALRRIILTTIFSTTLFVSLVLAEEAASGMDTAIAVPRTETEIRDTVLDAVSSEDFSDLSFALRSAKPAELVPIEKEILEIARTLNAASRLDVAGRLVETLLLNNIDNRQAQDLLVTIEEGRRKLAEQEALRRAVEAEAARKEAERQEAELRRLEEEERLRAAERAELQERERLQAEIARREVERQVAERNRLAEEKRQRETAEAERLKRELQAAEEAERREAELRKGEEERRRMEALEAVRLERERAEAERKERRLRRYTASADLAPVLVNGGGGSIAETDTSGAGLKYGVRFGARAAYRDDRVSLLWDLAYENAPVAFGGTETRGAFSTWVSLGSRRIGLPVFLDLGYRYFNVSPGVDEARLEFMTAGVPTLGLGIEGYPLADRFDLSGRFFWLPLSMIEPRIAFAFDIDLALRYEILRFGTRYTLFGLAGSTTTLIFADGGTENSESIYIAIGVRVN